MNSLSVCPGFTLEWLKLDPQTHIYIYIYIYIESVSPGEHHEHVYMATPLSVLKKIAKIDTFARNKNGAKPQTHIYLESVSPGERPKHIYMATSLSVLKKKKKKKKKSCRPKTWHADKTLFCKNIG